MATTNSNNPVMANVLEENKLAKPIVIRKAITATNLADMATNVDFDNVGSFIFDEPVSQGGTGLGPTPLQGVLAALCACESVTFNRVANEMGFIYTKLDFQAAFTIDIRGRSGVRGVIPHYQTVKVEVRVHTNEEMEQLQNIADETEARCPVYNLIKDANVRIKMAWLRVSPLKQ